MRYKTKLKLILNNIKKFCKEYRAEIIIEVLALLYIILAWRLGWINGFAINDGTFVVAMLSVPLVIVRYIIDKVKSYKEENNKFYYDILNKLLEISKDSMEQGVESSNLGVRLMQVENIKMQGESLLKDKPKETFEKAIKSTLINLLTYDIVLKQDDDNNICLSKKQDDNIASNESNTNESVKAFSLINQRIKAYSTDIQNILVSVAKTKSTDKIDLGEKEIKNSLKDSDIDVLGNTVKELSQYIKEKYNELVFWESSLDDEHINKLSREVCILYDCTFENLSSFEAVFKHLIINPTFEFDNSSLKDIYKMYDQYSGDEEDKEIIKNANFIIDGNDVELSFDNNDNKCNDDFYSYFVIDSDMSRQEMKNKYGGEKTEVKVSANYKKPNDENFYSWFTITKKQLQNAKDKEVDLWKFIIDGDKKKIVIVMGNNGLEKLLKKKEKLSSSDAESDDYRYHFYFNAIKTKGDNYIIEDSRFAGGAFKLNARKVDSK